MQNITLLGATGSIGRSTLDLIGRHPERFKLHAATAEKSWRAMADIVRQFQPRIVGLSDPSAAAALRAHLGPHSACEVLGGSSAHAELAASSNADTVVSAIVGLAGLDSVLAGVRAGKRVLIANKEPLVAAGALLVASARASGALILPLDSEHNAVLQCWPAPFALGESDPSIRSITLTASGGPFLRTPRAELEHVTVAQAIKHPRWSMGPKISVDSATLMNKGLEVIEAQVLFSLTPESINVLIHPQSVVHALVEYLDGSSLAQLGAADMRIPIAHAMGWPERIESGAERLNLAALGQLSFEEVDLEQFPCLALARAACERADAAPLVLNAANEVAVSAFLDGAIGFLDISRVVEHALERVSLSAVSSLDDILERDQVARRVALTAFLTLQ